MDFLVRFFFPCRPLFSLLLCGDKMSSEFCVDKPFHQLQIDSSSVQARQGIALFVCALLLSLSLCLLPCCHASCCIPRRQTLVIFVLQCTTLVCVLQKAHQATSVWRWEVFPPQRLRKGNIFMVLTLSIEQFLKYLCLFVVFFKVKDWLLITNSSISGTGLKGLSRKTCENFLCIHRPHTLSICPPSRLIASITSKFSCGWTALISTCAAPMPSVLFAPT